MKMTAVPVRKPSYQAADIDRIVGLRIKERRVSLGLSQKTLADQLGISVQQFAKYENGHSRIVVSSLYMLAIYLSVDFKYFYETIQITSSNRNCNDRNQLIELQVNFSAIRDQRMQFSLLELAINMSRRRSSSGSLSDDEPIGLTPPDATPET